LLPVVGSLGLLTGHPALPYCDSDRLDDRCNKAIDRNQNRGLRPRCHWREWPTRLPASGNVRGVEKCTGGVGGGRDLEAAFAEAAALAFEGDHGGVVDEPSIRAAATIASPRISPHCSKSRLLVTTIEPRS
jgi:hypothetical protein